LILRRPIASSVRGNNEQNRISIMSTCPLFRFYEDLWKYKTLHTISFKSYNWGGFDTQSLEGCVAVLTPAAIFSHFGCQWCLMVSVNDPAQRKESVDILFDGTPISNSQRWPISCAFPLYGFNTILCQV
jgi:hypothetical protein